MRTLNQIKCLLRSELHALAAEGGDYEYITITVGLWGDTIINYSDSEHLADSLSDHAKYATKHAQASAKHASEFIARDGNDEGGDQTDAPAKFEIPGGIERSEAFETLRAKLQAASAIEPEFKVGDVVRLKSGGPKMTVVDVDEDRDVDCKYVRPDGDQRNYCLPAAALRDASGDLA